MVLKRIGKFKAILVLAVLAFIGLTYLRLHNLANLPCANTLSCEQSLKLNIDNNDEAVFNGKMINPPKVDLANVLTEPRVLGAQTGQGEKHIYVDLTTQTLKAYQGNTLFLETKISSGKWYPTPTGDFTIWNKLRATLMSGGEGADYYYLPNVPYTMYFYNSQVSQSRGFALHGTYWHDNFGHPMSHGCVNMRTVDAQKLYYWTDPPTPENGSALVKDGSGTKITIYGTAP